MNSKLIIRTGAFICAAMSATAYAQELQEIVVTAQKRSERLQDVPLSITAITADALKDAGVNNLSDINVAVPGIYVGRTTNQSTIYIRGIGSLGGSPGNEAAVATSVDGVYLPSGGSTVMALNNIERVEVLKGPQGTLYGRNATAGAINVITRTPSQNTSVEADIGYGNLETVQGNFYATTGLTDSAAIDIAGHYQHMGKGFGRNLFTGKKVAYDNVLALKSKLFFEPTEALTITLSADYAKIGGVNGTNQRQPQGSASLLTGETGWTRGFFNVNENLAGKTHNKQYGGSAKIEYDLETVKFTAITAYRYLKAGYMFDVDATPVDAIVAEIPEKNKQFSQELQLASESGGKLQWVVGVFFLDGRVKANTITTGGFIAPVVQLQSPSGQKTTSISGYAQGTYEFAQDTRLTIGGRYTSDKRKLSARSFLILPGNTVVQTVAPFTATTTFKKPTWKIGVDHKFSPDVLAYANYSRGFKSGIYNLLAISTPVVKPEVVNAYEVGLKSELLDRRLRLNVAGYYYDYKNIQLQVSTNQVAFLTNAAQAEIYGLDMDFMFVASDRLTLSGGGGWIHGRYTSYPNAPCLNLNPAGGYLPGSSCDASGNKTIRTPKFSFNASVDYHFPAFSGEMAFNVQHAHYSGWKFEPDNRLTQNAFDLVNAQVKWTSPDKGYDIRLWSQNLFNKKYFAQNGAINPFGDVSHVAPGRSYGVSVGARF